MNFSKTASYSLSVLSYMATHEELSMSAAYLHEKLSIPYPYLRQVLSSLSRSGFIKSARGRSGGYSFDKQKNEISLADIIDATDGLESFNKCILGFKECPFSEHCAMHSTWESTRAGIIKILRETSLADLIQKKTQ
jgi:Rrf2 family transcriptional regulator, iron-sulfur cluster assembly transcription factor